MTAYCERQGFQAGTVRFMFDGNQIGAEQTPIEVSSIHLSLSLSLSLSNNIRDKKQLF